MYDTQSKAYITATQLRAKLGGMSRTAWWRMEKKEGFPQAFMLPGNAKLKLYDLAEIEAWLAANLVVHPKSEPPQLRGTDKRHKTSPLATGGV